MTIEKSDRFRAELEEIVDYIAEDNVKRAVEFYDAVVSRISKIPENPYAYRKRESLNDEFVREMIYKGYTIPYLIDSDRDKIIVLGIFNRNIWQ